MSEYLGRRAHILLKMYNNSLEQRDKKLDKITIYKMLQCQTDEKIKVVDIELQNLEDAGLIRRHGNTSVRREIPQGDAGLFETDYSIELYSITDKGKIDASKLKHFADKF